MGKKLDFGMPTLIELEDLQSCVRFCKEMNLSFIEINMNLPIYQTNQLNPEYLLKAMEEGVYFTFHLDEKLSPADVNDEIAEAYLHTVLQTIEIAKKVHSPIINMHMDPGIYFTLPNERVFIFERYNDAYMEKLKRFRDSCEQAAKDSDIKICIENCSGYLPFMEKGIEFLLESPIFALTLDIGHNYCAGGVDKEFMQANSERLVHMHIHDALHKNCHLVLGEGELDLHQELKRAENCDCRIVIETKSAEGLRQSVNWLNTEYLSGHCRV